MEVMPRKYGSRFVCGWCGGGKMEDVGGGNMEGVQGGKMEDVGGGKM